MGRIEVKIEGRSGCGVKIYQSKGSILLRKVSPSVQYNHRLLKQCLKQEAFYCSEYLRTELQTPKVINQKKDGFNISLFWFDMEYVQGEKFSDFFVKAQIPKIYEIIERLLNYINSELCNCVPEEVDQIIQQKVIQLQSIVDAKFKHNLKLHAIWNYLENRMPSSKLPVGLCHGDLTFSNMIFTKESIFLIDFLDSFLDSPLLDLVKLRQDTKFYWSLLIDNQIDSTTRTKMQQILDFFDQKITAYLNENSYTIPWYEYLEKLNLVRILPYLSNNNEILHIMNCLENGASNL